MKRYRVIKKQDAKIKDLGTKKIRKYTSRNKKLEINHMKVSGRHPEGRDSFMYETSCYLMFYIFSGTDEFFYEDSVFHLRKGDVLEIPPKTKFAVKAKLVEYLSLQHPAWSKEQSFIVDLKGDIIENNQR